MAKKQDNSGCGAILILSLAVAIIGIVLYVIFYALIFLALLTINFFIIKGVYYLYKTYRKNNHKEKTTIEQKDEEFEQNKQVRDSIIAEVNEIKSDYSNIESNPIKSMKIQRLVGNNDKDITDFLESLKIAEKTILSNPIISEDINNNSQHVLELLQENWYTLRKKIK